MWPLKSIILEKLALSSEGFIIHYLRFLKDIAGKTITFQSKPRHVTPQINRLGKMSISSEGFITHYLEVSQEIDGKMFTFRVTLGMWPLRSYCISKMCPVLRVSTHIYGVSQGDRWVKCLFIRVNIGMWPLKLIVLEKRAKFWGFHHTYLSFSQEIDGKMFTL